MLQSLQKIFKSTESLNADIEGEPTYRDKIAIAVQEGCVFLIRGQILPDGDRFIIDFILDSIFKDIALRLDTRSSNNTLGCNSRLNYTWSPEESAPSSFCLLNDLNFDIQVLFITDNVLIAFEGLHVAKYAHRLPLDRIRKIEIYGKVRDINVQRQTFTSYPLRHQITHHISRIRCVKLIDIEVEASGNQFPLPYYATFDKGFFKVGYGLAVEGQVGRNPNKIKIALQLGQNIWPQPTVALQLEFNFIKNSDGETDEPVVTLKSFALNEWAAENQPELVTGLRPESDFNLLIVNGLESFEIYLNYKHVYDYSYISESDCINTCFVEGDINLLDVRINII